MADEKSKAPPPPTAAATAAAKPSKLGAILTVVLSALFATGGAFGGAKFGAASAAAHKPAPVEHAPAIPTVHAPGVTVPLEPFLVSVTDAAGKARAVKVTLALELRPKELEEGMKPFVPRIRDSTLSYLRALSFEEAASNQRVEKMRTELLERYMKLGALAIEQILITDFVAQ